MSNEKMLVVTTAHLQESTNDALMEGNVEIEDIWNYQWGYGFFVAAVLASYDNSIELPAELVEIAKWAKDQEATVLLFDNAGDEIANFKTYDW